MQANTLYSEYILATCHLIEYRPIYETTQNFFFQLFYRINSTQS